MSTRMQQRRGTAAQWLSTNNGNGPILAAGEHGYESDTNKFKIGDGVNHWIDLEYFLDSAALGGSLEGYVAVTELGQPGGVATLDLTGKLTAAQIPNIDEISQDAINNALVAGLGIEKTYDDVNNTITIANTGVTSVVGTPNEIEVSAETGSIEIGLPTNVSILGTLTLSSDPVSSLEAATKQYVDNISAGITFHEAVRVATTENITLSGTQTVDGVALALGDRVLVKNQTDAKQNGYYVVESAAWTRSLDADNSPDGELKGGDFTLVTSGTVNSGYGFVCSNIGTVSIGVDEVTYVPFNAAKSVEAGYGLVETNPGILEVDTAITATLDGISTLTNKTINLANNSVTATISELNSAVSDANLVTVNGVETLENKTLTDPVINAPMVSNGTFGTPELTDPTIIGAAVQGTVTLTGTISGGTIDADALTLNSVDVATVTDVSTAIGTHNEDTTSVHGIADTALLVTTTGTQTLSNKTLESPIVTVSAGVSFSMNTGYLDSDGSSGTTYTFYDDQPGFSDFYAYFLSLGGTQYGSATGPITITGVTSGGYISGTNTVTMQYMGNSIFIAWPSIAYQSGATFTSPTIGWGGSSVTVSATEISYLYGVTSGIQGQLDAKASTSALSSHESDTTNIHGIADTAALATKTYADETAASIVAAYNADTTDVHGIADTAELATKTYANSAVSIAVAALDKSSVGLANVDNTADADKPVSTATQTALDLKAPKASPTFTGTLTADAVTITGDLTVGGTTTTVNAANLNVTDPMIYMGDGNTANLVDLGFVSAFNDGTYQHTGLVRDSSDGKWKLFKGVTDEPTTTVNFTQGSLDALAVGALEVGSVSNTEIGYLDGVTSGIQDQIDAKLATATAASTYATIASPALTGTPTAPTAALLTNTTQVATTEYVQEDNKVAYVTEAGTSVTVSSSTHKFKTVHCTSSTAVTVTIPTDTTDNWPVGTYVNIRQMGTGQITVVAGGIETTVVATDNQLKTRVRYSEIVLEKIANNSWIMVGDTAA